MRRENDLGKDKVFGLLIRLAIPAMIAQLVNVLYSIVDRIYISHIPDVGNLALAGVGICAPIIVIITSFCYLFGLGGAPLLAISLGEQNKEKAQKILANSFMSLLAISIVIMALFLSIKQFILRWFGASATIFPYANDYLTIYLYGTVFAILSLGLNSFISCQGFSKVAMASVLVGALANILLDPLFIFTFKLGIKGAAIATVVAQALSCIWVVLFLLGKRTAVKLSFKGFDIKLVGRIVTLGISPFLIMATEGVIIIALNYNLQKFGGANGDNLIASATIVVSCMQLITSPLGGITMGAQPVMSYNFGAMQFDRIKQAMKYLFFICLVYTSIMFIITMAFPQLFIKIFSRDPNIVQMTIKGIRAYMLGVVFLSSQYAVVDSFTALGCAKYAITLSLARKLLILMSLTFILPIFFGAESAYYAEAIADIVGGCVCAIVYFCTINKIFDKRKLQKNCVDNGNDKKLAVENVGLIEKI
ncbi:MAG: MATE family efflux transporter [Clostridia bacterium]